MNNLNRNFTLKDEIRAYWSERAATFDLSASHRIENRYGMPEWHRLVRTAMNLEQGKMFAGLKALDIACGTGEISRVMTSLGADVTAVDFSETMLDIARDKLRDASWQGILADAEALHPLEDDSFDFAVTRHLAWTLTDPLAAYSEWRRVLRADGKLLIVDGDWTAPHGRLIRLRRWLAERITPVVPRSAEDKKKHEDILTRLYYSNGLTATLLKDDLRAVGFNQFTDLPVERLYGHGMRGVPLSDRLRQTAKHRFAFVAS